MAESKHYYYIRLKENFFESTEIQILESMPDGYRYSNILLKLYLKSLTAEGKLLLNNAIPLNSQMISTITHHPVGVVEKALDIFLKLGLIEILEDGTIYMLNIEALTGKSSSDADRKRIEYRAKQNLKNGDFPEISPPEDGDFSQLEISPPELRDRDRVRERDKDTDSSLRSSSPPSRDENAAGNDSRDDSSELFLAEASEAAAAKTGKDIEDPTFIEMPIVGGKTAAIPESFVEQMEALYQACDVRQSIRNAVGWCIANPTHRKKDWKRFLTSWIQRDNDRARAAPKQQSGAASSQQRADGARTMARDVPEELADGVYTLT